MPSRGARASYQSTQTGLIQADPSGYVLRFATATGHGVGKMQYNASLLPTPKGMVRMGDIQPGDCVFGSNGTPTKVLNKIPQTGCDMMRVTFDDGSYLDVAKEHEWDVKGRQQRRYGKDHPKSVWITLETQEIVAKGVKRKNGTAMAREWQVPVQGAVEFDEQPLPMDAYTLGAFLGDGHKSSFTNPEVEIIEKIAVGHDIVTYTDQKITLDGRQVAHGIRGIRPALRELGLFESCSWNKFIPDAVKYNSIYARHQCLMGLMDTDGYVDESGRCTYSTASMQLAEDIVWLARSLGCKARIQPTTKKPTYTHNGEKKQGRDSHIVTITAPKSFKMFSLSRKEARRKEIEPRYICRWIESIEPLGKGDGACITVEAEDGLYQAGDFIVTHNSAMMSWLILWFLSTRYPAKGVTTANTLGQLSGTTWAELAKWHNRIINKHWFTWTATSIHLNEAPRINFINAAPNNEHNSEAFQGLHQEHVFIGMDEASKIPNIIWEVCDGAMTTPRAMMFCYGNPTQPTGRFRECFGRLKHRWTTRSIDSRSCKMTNKEEIAKWFEDNDEDSDFIRIRVKGMFPRQASNQFISSEDVSNAQQREIHLEAFTPLPKIMAVDVARYGSDESVICVIQGRKQLVQVAVRNRDTMTVASWIVEHIKEHNPDIINVDGVGIGAGVVDRLRQLGYQISEVNGGLAPTSNKMKESVYNRRAEMWFRMRDWLKTADIVDDQQLFDDLIGPEYSYDNKMRVQIEKKEDMAKRGLSSPDRGDALSMCFFEQYPQNMRGQSHIPDEAEFV